MSLNERITYRDIVGRMGELQQRIKKLTREAQARADAGIVRDFLAGVDATLADVQAGLRELAPELSQSRFAALASRIAVHFFCERAMSRFCERVLDELIDEAGAGSGAVILFESETSEARLVAARAAQGKRLEPDQVRVSRTILSRIRDGEDSVLVEDAIADAVLSDEESIQKLNLRSVLAIPLRFQEYLAGAIHLDNERAKGAFGEEERSLLLGVGRLVAIYLNAAFRLDEEIAARERIYNEVKGKTHFDGIVGSSSELKQVLDTVAQVGPSQATVLLEGESGTGKELVARAVHLSSKQHDKPMVVVNCAAIPESLLESELFGHERGAFTGAFERRVGRFEQADGTTLFLDEIGELTSPLQAKLLRFLQSGELQRLGGTRTIKVDARLVAATNQDISAMVRRGEFREDLFYRLYVVPIRVPALRERLEDIPLLVDHFCRVFSLQTGRQPVEIDSEVYDALQRYSWPGNIRELENLMQRLVVLSKGGRIGIGDLPEHVFVTGKPTMDIGKDPFRRFLSVSPASYQEFKRRRDEMQSILATYAQKLENNFIDKILENAGGNVSRAAEQAGIHRTLIHRNLRTRARRDS